MGSTDQPKRPADAYFIMEELLGEGWFLRSPPTRGAILEVAAMPDGCLTQWAMTTDEASNLIPALRSDRRVTTSSVCKF